MCLGGSVCPAGAGEVLVGSMCGELRAPLQSLRVARSSRVPGVGLSLAPGRSLDVVVGGGQQPSGAQNSIRALPEIARDMLAACFDIRDRAAAVIDLGREPGLAVSSRATICG